MARLHTSQVHPPKKTWACTAMQVYMGKRGGRESAKQADIDATLVHHCQQVRAWASCWASHVLLGPARWVLRSQWVQCSSLEVGPAQRDPP
jgi:hypothetical protein